jgi:hypothetical protein
MATAAPHGVACPRCPLAFTCPSRLRKHWVKHQDDGARPFACESCSALFKSHDARRKLVRKQHERESAYRRLVCREGVFAAVGHAPVRLPATP